MPDLSQWQPRKWPISQPFHCPDISTGKVQVWRVNLDCTETVKTKLYSYLSADERDRAARFKFDHHRHHFIAARGFLRLILATSLNQPPASLMIEYGDRGKPFLSTPPQNSKFNPQPSTLPLRPTPPLHFNVSHSDGVALYAISRDRPVGIDIEAIRTVSSITDLAQRFFFAEEAAVIQNLQPPQQEIAFFRGWTRKEAYLKATGDGLSGLETIPVALLTPISAQTHTQMTIGDNWWLTDIALEDDLMGAIAIGIEPSPPSQGSHPAHEIPPPLQFFHLIPV
ncbi:MAG: 4'-phosphopantetheinyl transferase superfamily protein [Cyanothece sp. SIO2G6]|nr:4'-phosphopantetheinyl transferase superfamily protein [Cyanothece sp. SIO2G6]